MLLKTYEVNTGRRFDSDRPHSILFIADLHGRCEGSAGEEILRIARETRPDLIAAGGDMVRCATDYDAAPLVRLFSSLRAVAPVVSVDGNHEQHMRKDPIAFGPAYHRYIRSIRDEGVICLDNASIPVTIDGMSCTVYGYVLPFEKYGKFRPHSLKRHEITDWIGRKDRRNYGILLTHNPAFAPSYFDWGADLVLAGHYHGGLIRAGNRALLSPYGFPFPRFGYGKYEKDGKTMIVTGGAGDHRIAVRIGNPHEVVLVRLHGKEL